MDLDNHFRSSRWFIAYLLFPCSVLPTGGCRNPGIRTQALVPTRRVEEKEEERAPQPLLFCPSCSSASEAPTVLSIDTHFIVFSSAGWVPSPNFRSFFVLFVSENVFFNSVED